MIEEYSYEEDVSLFTKIISEEADKLLDYLQAETNKTIQTKQLNTLTLELKAPFAKYHLEINPLASLLLVEI